MERDFDALHRQVLFEPDNRKIIWQPRIGCWLTDRQFAGEPLPAPYTGMSLPEIYRSLGCSNRIYEYNRCFRPVEPDSVRHQTRELNDTDVEHVIETPVGRQRCVLRRSPNNRGMRHVKWWISDEAEMKVAIWRSENTSWTYDEQAFAELAAEWAGLGAPTAFLPRVTVQHLFIDDMGVEAGVYALADYPDTVEAYFAAHEACIDRLIEVVNASPIDIINFGDNIHAGTCSPDLFRRYVLPAYQRRCRKLHAAGKFVHAHWDGDTAPLLPLARETGMDGVEAVTPEPQGDVTPEEIKEAFGEELFLLDGIPAIYFDDYTPLNVLTDCARRTIEMFAPKLVLGISDEISSTGDIERIRTVGEIVQEYNRQFD